VLHCFHMAYWKPLSVLISMGIDILVDQCSTTLIEMEDMDYIPYSSVVGSFMYVMVCTRLHIVQVVGVLS